MNTNIGNIVAGKNTKTPNNLMIKNIGFNQNRCLNGSLPRKKSLMRRNMPNIVYIKKINNPKPKIKLVSYIRPIVSKSQPSNTSNAFPIIGLAIKVPGSCLEKLDTFTYVLFNEDTNIRNMLFKPCAILPTTSGLRSIVPKPVPISKPHNWIILGIRNSFILSMLLWKYFSDYTTKRIR